jgi:hypothetical protein
MRALGSKPRALGHLLHMETMETTHQLNQHLGDGAKKLKTKTSDTPRIVHFSPRFGLLSPESVARCGFRRT